MVGCLVRLGWLFEWDIWMVSLNCLLVVSWLLCGRLIVCLVCSFVVSRLVDWSVGCSVVSRLVDWSVGFSVVSRLVDWSVGCFVVSRLVDWSDSLGRKKILFSSIKNKINYKINTLPRAFNLGKWLSLFFLLLKAQMPKNNMEKADNPYKSFLNIQLKSLFLNC